MLHFACAWITYRRGGVFESALIAALMPLIDVPATISIFILLFVRALKTPHPNAPNEPPP